MAYTDKQKKTIVDRICSEIAEKGRALRNIIKDKGMPDITTFYDWIDNDEEKSKQYARATKDRADKIFEDILIIADDQEGDVIQTDEGEVTNHNVIQRARLRVDSRKWMLGKMNPKKYGDKLETETKHSGEIKIIRTIKK